MRSQAMTNETSRRSAPILLAAGFLLILLVINTTIVCYPSDNDLDEIGWLADHLTLSRPESLANANYPPGLPVLLRFLTPLIGGLLMSALVCSAVACTAIALLTYRLSVLICTDTRTALATLVLVGVVVFRSATSEFADTTATALFLGSLCVYLSHLESRRHHLIAGVLIGFAYLFRYHYLMFAILVPVASVVLGGTKRQMLHRALVYVGGFLLGALPLLVLSAIAHGNPFSTGLSPYLVGQHATKTVSWGNYLATYDQWPLWRLLTESPWVLVWHLAQNASTIISRAPVFAAALLSPVFLSRTDRSTQTSLPAFLGVCAALYLLIVVSPTQVTNRALLPAEALLSVLIVQGLARMVALIGLRSKPCLWLYGAVAVMLVGSVPHSFRHIQDKRQAQTYNRTILDKLGAAGMTSSSQVLCTTWDLYPLDDPKFVTFYNYGGWLLLDSEYAARRPAPRATTVDEWRDFMRQHGLRYLVCRIARETQEFFTGPQLPAEWELIQWDGKLAVLALLPGPP